ncbi:Membrane protein involved in the export of O-antigen and teichoic acid [Oribacterium sp. KHPX15]|uniref:polysaccharide biosynthesis C-terminal domain-containing protein n=1 Tax=Oribacterium sp. KHPX15 TaxID=1855342 RepID=UPI0008945CD4|nr:polysaccharide biosynthesis C-terminal domain-containing protein [Oribacterium sp. KHPX15]SEA56822.1 Membrane protein involved in the export of O-antigen and teichoic acid [Oribacterium sp. KHPX15]
MKLERSKNTKKGVIAGTLNRVIAILFPFLIRTAMIHKMGVDYLGLNSLFSSILQVLSLSELGFSSAIIYSMYKPLAENDTDTVNALLFFYRKVYRVIGLFISLLGLLLLPLLPKLINGTVPPDINLYLIYLVYLFNTVISYFFYGYLSSVLNANQRIDIVSIVTILSQTVGYIGQLIVVLTISNYYIYALFLPLSTVINNLLTAYAVKKMYPEYRCAGEISQEQKLDIRKRVYGIMIEKVCGTTRNALDSICISAVVGLAATALYNNYFYISSSLTTIFYVVLNAMQPGIGNSMALDSEEKNYKDMAHLNFGYMLISGWSFVCLICLYQPFMTIWVGEKYLLPFSSVLLFSVYFYILRMGDIRSVYAQAAGLWWENRYLAVAESIVNVVLNITLVSFFGINGIIVATIISLFGINFCLSSGIVFKHYFKNGKLREFFGQHFVYAVVTGLVCTVTYQICDRLPFNGIILLFTRAMICVLVPAVAYMVAYIGFRFARESFNWILERVIGRKVDFKEIIKKIDKKKMLQETVIFIVLVVCFFFAQEYIPNLSYMYFDSVSLMVRGLYAVVLADVTIWTFRKAIRLTGRAIPDFEEKLTISETSQTGNSTIVNTSQDEKSITEGTSQEETIMVGKSLESFYDSAAWNKFSDTMFYLAFFGCYALAYIAITKLNVVIPVYGGIHRLGITLCCMLGLLLYNRKNVTEKWIFAFQTIILISAIGYMGRYGDIWIYAMAIFTVVSHDRKFMPIMYITLIFNGVMLFTVSRLANAGVIEFIIKRGKLAFGYGGPNEASMQILFFEITYFYVRYFGGAEKLLSEKVNEKVARFFFGLCDMSVLLLGTVAIVKYTAGRASIVCVLILLIGTIIFKLIQWYPIRKWHKGIQFVIDKVFLIGFVPMFIYVTIVSFAASYYYDDANSYKWLELVGKVFDVSTLKSRLSLGKQALMQFKPELWGANIVESSEENYFWVDNYYIRAWLKYGILLFICGIIVFTLVNYVCWLRKEYYILFLMAIIAGLGFLEATIGDIMYDVFPLLLFTCDKGILAIGKNEKYLCSSILCRRCT